MQNRDVPDQGNPDRMLDLPGWVVPDNWATTAQDPPAVVPVRADLWTGEWNGPYPVLVAHSSAPAWTPMWGLRAPEGGELVVAGDYELNQTCWAANPQPPRGIYVPLDQVYVLIVDASGRARPPVDPPVGRPTEPPVRLLSPAVVHVGSLLGRRAWRACADGWKAVTICSDPYYDELPLIDQIARGAADDDTTDQFVQVCRAGYEVSWGIDGDEPPTSAALARTIWL